jgi:nitroimidazol reductase NimA-like FMN-containing flavoprotein (pyridoxamine 5'-phosphate oxidase superfamily)
MTYPRRQTQRDEMTAPTFDSWPQVLAEDECLALLRSRELGRVAFKLDGPVEILPVNYVIEGTIIVFRTSLGTKLSAVARAQLAFEVDSWDPASGIGWSVVARGPAEEVTTNPGRVAEHLRWVPVHPVAPGDRWHWVGLKPSDISGRRFHVPPPTRERGA